MRLVSNLLKRALTRTDSISQRHVSYLHLVLVSEDFSGTFLTLKNSPNIQLMQISGTNFLPYAFCHILWSLLTLLMQIFA